MTDHEFIVKSKKQKTKTKTQQNALRNATTPPSIIQIDYLSIREIKGLKGVFFTFISTSTVVADPERDPACTVSFFTSSYKLGSVPGRCRQTGRKTGRHASTQARTHKLIERNTHIQINGETDEQLELRASATK